jgi:hypothetical protein
VILMIDTDDATGAERWAMTRVADKKSRATESQGEFWKREMGWPAAVREPTFDEVGQFLAHNSAKVRAKYSSALAEAVRLDAAEGFVR